MKKILLAVALVFMAALPAFAADGETISFVTRGSEDFTVVKVEWTAAANGTKANTTIPAGMVAGRVIMFVTDPGTTAPAGNYDLTILDSGGMDIAGGALANRHTSNSEQAIPLSGALAMPSGRPTTGALTITYTDVSNANATGTIYIYFVE